MKNQSINEAILIHYNQLVNNYEIAESHEEEEIEYVVYHKKTGDPYIRLYYSETESLIDVRLLSIKAACLVHKTSEQILSDFSNLTVEELVDAIAYIDIPGNPGFYYSAELSNKNLAIFEVAMNKGLQVKLIALIAEVRLALKFSGLVYSKHH